MRWSQNSPHRTQAERRIRNTTQALSRVAEHYHMRPDSMARTIDPAALLYEYGQLLAADAIKEAHALLSNKARPDAADVSIYGRAVQRLYAYLLAQQIAEQNRRAEARLSKDLR